MKITGYLICLGLFFPAVAWLSVVTAVLEAFRKKRRVSLVFIPLVGPILLTISIIVEGYSRWWILIAWLGDIGTIGLLPHFPSLIRDYWNDSRFTQIAIFQGVNGNQSVVISLHNAGNYALRKSWTLPQGQKGTVSLGEPGTFSCECETIVLTSHLGVIRKLIPQDDGHYQVEEDLGKTPDVDRYSINGWTLSRHASSK